MKLKSRSLSRLTLFLFSVVFLGILMVMLLQKGLGGSIIEKLVNSATMLVQDVSYFGIFITMALESALVPIPSEVVMPFAGFLSWEGKMNLLFAIAMGTAGNLAGSLALYALGSGPGFSIIKKYGRYLLIDDRDIERAQNLFFKYGGPIVFAGRMMPAIRTVISLPAGIAKMNLWKFTAFTLLGSLPWNALLAYLGWLLGENWSLIEKYAKFLDYISVSALILLIAGYIIYKKNS